MSNRINCRLPSDLSLPAGGRGAVGIECRTGDQTILDLLAPLNHVGTAHCVLAERAVNRHLQGGCQCLLPVLLSLMLAQPSNSGLVGSIDGSTILRADIEGVVEQAEQLGVQLAEQLLAQGAKEILAGVYGS